MPPRFEDPQLFSHRAGELALSGAGLFEIMRAVLDRGRPIRFSARGWSMAPFIRDGDIITLAPLTPDGPRAGDIVAFVRPETGSPVIHRIVARRGLAWQIRGDNNGASGDDLVAANDVLGRVTRIERNGRRVRLGLGPERAAIAWFSRTGLLMPVGGRLAAWFRVISGRWGWIRHHS